MFRPNFLNNSSASQQIRSWNLEMLLFFAKYVLMSIWFWNIQRLEYMLEVSIVEEEEVVRIL